MHPVVGSWAPCQSDDDGHAEGLSRLGSLLDLSLLGRRGVCLISMRGWLLLIFWIFLPVTFKCKFPKNGDFCLFMWENIPEDFLVFVNTSLLLHPQPMALTQGIRIWASIFSQTCSWIFLNPSLHLHLLTFMWSVETGDLMVSSDGPAAEVSALQCPMWGLWKGLWSCCLFCQRGSLPSSCLQWGGRGGFHGCSHLPFILSSLLLPFVCVTQTLGCEASASWSLIYPRCFS